MLDTKVRLNTCIARLTKSERVTKAALQEAADLALDYLIVQDSGDIDSVNRLINCLSPSNKKSAIIFFDNFLYYTFDDEALRFTEKWNAKAEGKLNRIREAVTEFLDDDAQNYWTWVDREVQVVKKPKDFAHKITTLVKKALTDKEEKISAIEALEAAMAGGITVVELLAEVEAWNNREQALEEYGPVKNVVTMTGANHEDVEVAA